MRRSSIRFAFVALTSAPFVALATSPAFALASFSVSGNCGYNQVCSAYAQSVIGAGTGTSVEVACNATTPYVVQATIAQCYIVGNAGDVHWTPAQVTQGQTSTVIHNFPAWELRSNAYRVCTGGGVFTNVGDYRHPANFVCGTLV